MLLKVRAEELSNATSLESKPPKTAKPNSTTSNSVNSIAVVVVLAPVPVLVLVVVVVGLGRRGGRACRRSRGRTRGIVVVHAAVVAISEEQ